MVTSGVVSNSGVCCTGAVNATAPVLDRDGMCCASNLDACGVCGGRGNMVDIAGGCCDGVLAANGRCCAATNVLDNFGVCDGSSSSGDLLLSVAVQTNAPGKSTMLLVEPDSMPVMCLQLELL